MHSTEVTFSPEQESAYVDQVRTLIDAVAGDAALSTSDRSRIVDLLRKVEQALLDITINGTLPLQEAAAAAGAIVRLSFWERVKSRPWARDFGATMVALFMALEGTANVLQIEQAFSDDPQQVVVVERHVDDNGQSADPSEKERTPPGR